MVDRSIARSRSSSISPMRMLGKGKARAWLARGGTFWWVRIEAYDDNNCKMMRRDGGRSGWGQNGKERAARHAHHVTFDKVQPEGHLLDTFVYAVDTFFGIGEDNVGFLVIACQHTLEPPK